MKISEIEKHKISIIPRNDVIDGRLDRFIGTDAVPGHFKIVDKSGDYEVETDYGSWSLKDCRLMVMTEVECKDIEHG